MEGNIVEKIEELHKLANGLIPQKLEMNARKIQVINAELDQILRKTMNWFILIMILKKFKNFMRNS